MRECKMTGAIEFLRKAKAICDNTHPCADECPLNDWCRNEDDMNISDLVRKVMEYQIKEDGELQDAYNKALDDVISILSEQKEPATDNNVVTIGDKIRESNESLAEFIKQYDAQAIDDCYCRKLCEHRVDGGCELEECDRSNYNGISEYLNQPYTES